MLVPLAVTLSLFAQPRPGRDPKQPVEEEYAKKIREYTTEPFFNSPLTDYLPASRNVPTPKAVLGDVGGSARHAPLFAGCLSLYADARAFEHAAVIDSPYGEGHVALFSNNPFWRAETKGSYFLVFNAILNFDNLNAGRLNR